MYYLIYKITNLVNNKIYIGKHQTENKEDEYMGSGKILHKAIEKYGIYKFKKEILFGCANEEEMNQKEAVIVDEEFIARLETYNMKLGGQGGWDHCNNNSEMQAKKAKDNWIKYGKNHPLIIGIKNFWDSLSEEEYNNYIERISKSCKEYYKTHDNPFKGKKHTEESKRKIGKANSINQKGELNSHYGCCWIHNDELKENKSIKKELLEEYLNNGWEKGSRKIYYKNKKSS